MDVRADRSKCETATLSLKYVNGTMASNTNKYVGKSENVLKNGKIEISDDEYDEEEQIEELTIEKIVN